MPGAQFSFDGLGVQTKSSAFEASKVVSLVPATLMSVMVFNNSASAQWLHIWDRTAAPANATVPDFPPIPIPANTAAAFDIPMQCSTGITVAISTTAATFTAGSTTCMFLTRHLV